MTKHCLIFLLLCTSFLGLKSTDIKAQITVNVGAQPNWGPIGYDRVDYYYLPDIDAYYYVPKRQFIYQDGRNWVFKSSLPVVNRKYDLYHGYKVVINEPRPYLRNNVHRSMYARYKGDRSQAFLKANRKGKKYWSNGNRGYGKYGEDKYGEDKHGEDKHGEGKYGEGKYGNGKKVGEGHKEKKEKRDD